MTEYLKTAQMIVANMAGQAIVRLAKGGAILCQERYYINDGLVLVVARADAEPGKVEWIMQGRGEAPQFITAERAAQYIEARLESRAA